MENAQLFYELDEESQKLKKHAENQLYEAVQKNTFNKMLEVGCGNGAFLQRFPQHKIYGIDINQEMLALAQGLQGKLSNVNIVSDNEFVTQNKQAYDLITANYVFTELKQDELKEAFANIHQMLDEKGRLYFTITNPQTRHDPVFPGYKLIFDEAYAYEKEDLPFEVHLRRKDGTYVDVGIRDYHQPLETYEQLLKQAGFKEVKKTNIDKDHTCSYALLFEVKK